MCSTDSEWAISGAVSGIAPRVTLWKYGQIFCFITVGREGIKRPAPIDAMSAVRHNEAHLNKVTKLAGSSLSAGTPQVPFMSPIQPETQS